MVRPASAPWLTREVAGGRAIAVFTGDTGWAQPLTDPGRIAETVAAYRAFGADELMLYCYGDDVRQVESLAAIVH